LNLLGEKGLDLGGLQHPDPDQENHHHQDLDLEDLLLQGRDLEDLQHLDLDLGDPPYRELVDPVES